MMKNTRSLPEATAAVNTDTITPARGNRTNELKRTVVRGTDWKGTEAYLRVVDDAAGLWGHINMGGIYTDPLAPYRE